MSWERDKYFFSHVPSVLPQNTLISKKNSIVHTDLNFYHCYLFEKRGDAIFRLASRSLSFNTDRISGQGRLRQMCLYAKTSEPSLFAYTKYAPTKLLTSSFAG